MTVRQALAMSLRRTRERLITDLRTRWGQAAVVAFILALAAPFLVGSYILGIFTQMLIFTLAVVSWNMLAGYFGIFTFAHAAFFGIGAYATAITAAEYGVPLSVSLLLGGVAAAIISIPVCMPILRLRGAYVAMVTLAFAEITYLSTIVLRDVTGGPTGYTGIPRMFGGDRVLLFYGTLLVVTLVLLAIYTLLVSRFGLLARAIRESEEAAQMLGNDTYRYKLIGFVVGAGIAGIAGGLQAYHLLIVSPPTLEIERMIQFMAMGVIGGISTFGGGIVGVITVVGISEFLRPLGVGRLFLWGALLLVIILFFPDGIVGTDLKTYSLRDRIETLRERISELTGGDRT